MHPRPASILGLIIEEHLTKRAATHEVPTDVNRLGSYITAAIPGLGGGYYGYRKTEGDPVSTIRGSIAGLGGSLLGGTVGSMPYYLLRDRLKGGWRRGLVGAGGVWLGSMLGGGEAIYQTLPKTLRKPVDLTPQIPTGRDRLGSYLAAMLPVVGPTLYAKHHGASTGSALGTGAVSGLYGLSGILGTAMIGNRFAKHFPTWKGRLGARALTMLAAPLGGIVPAGEMTYARTPESLPVGAMIRHQANKLF